MRLIVLFAISLFLLIGCASLSPENVDNLPQDTTVLIISAVGNSLDVYEYTTWGGSKLLDSLDAEFWSLNRSLEDYIYNSLKNPRFKFYKYHELSDSNNIKLIRNKLTDEIDIDNFKSQIIDISKTHHIDKIILLSEEHYEWHNAILAGYGIYRYKSLLNFGKTVDGIAYACIKLEWYDSQTFESKPISFYYDMAGVGPEIIDKIYNHRDWSIFRNFKDEYTELFKNCLDIMIKKSALNKMQ